MTFTTLALLAAALQAFPAQARPGTVQGTVREEGTGAPVASATVSVPQLRRSVRTGEDGAFVLRNVAAGTWTVRATALDHHPAEAVALVPEGGVLRLDLEMARRPVPLERVDVRGKAPGTAPLVDPAGPGAARVDSVALRATPALAERDILRAVHALPSVEAASDFSSAPYIRGGSPDQTLVTLDGIPLYNPYHMGGLFSAVDPDAVQSVDVLAGAFPASVGDRASGAMDIRTRDGRTDRVRSTGALGLISARMGLDGPLPGRRGSWLVSARRTYVDVVTRAADAAEITDGHLPYAFHDGHLKLAHPTAGRGRLTVTAYANQERLRFAPADSQLSNQRLDYRWGSRAAGVQWRGPLGPGAWAEARAAWSSFGGRFRLAEHPQDPFGGGYLPQLDTLLKADTRLEDAQLAASAGWQRGAHRLGAGLELHHYRFFQDVVAVEEGLRETLANFAADQAPSTLSVWAEDVWTARPGVNLRGGVRVLAAGSRGTQVMPRLGGSWAATPRLTLSAAAGRSAQIMHSLLDSERVLSSVMAYDILAAGRRLTVSDDVVLGAAWAGGGSELRVDGYVRRVSGLPLPRPHEDPFDRALVHPDSFRTGSAWARGLEVLAGSRRGSAGVQVAYTLASVRRQLDTLRWTPRFERRHSVDASAWTGWGRGGQLSLRLLAASGQPYTPVVGLTRRWFDDPATGTLQEGYQAPEAVMGEYNSARLPAYLRLDVGARREYHPRWGGRESVLAPYFQVVNLLNRKNVLYALPDRDYRTGEAGSRVSYGPQFPIIPTLGVEWRF
ncbi:MAG TPA: TonB-dependent receptor [Longimicrobium sp.]|nr:TonB-dependent receptor [Longimicrobium sp.]